MTNNDSSALPPTPKPQLSPFRVVIALLLVAGVATGGYFGVRNVQTSSAAEAVTASLKDTWSAPYVDVTLTPTYAFQDRAANPARNVVLGFVVAGKDSGGACTPTWGTYASLAGAARSMDLDRRVAQVRGQGADAIVSFGGQANSELALTCRQHGRLAAAYRSVVDRYAADTVDFDIEGPALGDAAANTRRAKAMKVVQDAVRADGGRLAVWLTLPVTPDGLNADALAVVRAMQRERVDLAGVNIMAMDFGAPSAARDMLGAVKSSIGATHKQLRAIFRTESRARAWSRLGVTVMIGQNDVDRERLSVADVRALVALAADRKIARFSIWSLNRDVQCGSTFAVVGTHSNVCSGVVQKPLAFTKALARLRGSARGRAGVVTSEDALRAVSGSVKDDPARSPYPIWQPEQAYREGYKVVWRRAVYVAKWYSLGDTPDAESVAPGTPSSWRLIGPVLSTDRAPKIPKLPAGTHPRWSAGKAYRAGDKVLHHGLPYEARWYTEGDTPGSLAADGSPSPWKPRYKIPGEPIPG